MLFLLACAPAPAPEDAPWAAPDGPGPYAIGVETLTFVDDRGHDMTVEVWYPADVAAGTPADPYPEIGITENAHRDAAPDQRGAPYPLVAFSHGFGGIRYQSAFLTERLASHGYVVVAPDHAHNTLLDLDESLIGQVALDRPGDMVSAVNAAFDRSAGGDPTLGGMVQPDRYAMTGHSFGAWTTLSVAGGVIDGNYFADFCLTHADYDMCDATTVALMQAAAPPEAPDPRAVAAIPMAPCGWYTFGDAGLAGLAPSLMMGGTRDTSCSPEEEVNPAWDRAPPPTDKALIVNAGHYIYSDICVVAPFFADECAEEEAGYITMDAGHAMIMTLVTAWLGVNFGGDARDAAWITGDAPAFGGAVAWEERR